MSGIDRVSVLHQAICESAHSAHPHPRFRRAPREQRGPPSGRRLGFSPLPAGPLGALSLSLETYLQAKPEHRRRAGGLVDPATGLHTRPPWPRRARELGALMSRARGGLACVVFALEGRSADPKAGSSCPQRAGSDVVGTLSPTESPCSRPLRYVARSSSAQRIGGALRDGVARSTPPLRSALRVGYDAVTNLKYSPIDPVALLCEPRPRFEPAHQSRAARGCVVSDEAKASAPEAGAAPRTTPSGSCSANRGTRI